jgi:hypothetical protein
MQAKNLRQRQSLDKSSGSAESAGAPILPRRIQEQLTPMINLE